MKRILSLLLVLVMLTVSLTLISCSSEEPLVPPEGTVTRMTVDINPSVEFMIDDRNQVVAVTALNDDGSILIAGETFIGKTPEEATELVINLATNTGYLVKGNVTAEENTVKISVSGDSEYAERLREKVEKNTSALLEGLDVSAKIERVEALKTEALRALALSTSLYTEEEINAMSDEDLYKVISAGRIETALLLTEEMRKAYYTAKEYEISFAEREETAKVIEAMGGVYTLVHAGYKTALDLYSGAITALDEFRYSTLVSPESEYQKSLVALREAKTELLKQRTYTASLDINGEEYVAASVTLQMSEEQYHAALATYENLGKAANEALEALIAALRESEDALRALEENFSDDIKAELQAKAVEIENAMNANKDAFFAAFEAAHRSDIQKIEEDLIAQKQRLMDSVEF